MYLDDWSYEKSESPLYARDYVIYIDLKNATL